jgi:hypothetical protein
MSEGEGRLCRKIFLAFGSFDIFTVVKPAKNMHSASMQDIFANYMHRMFYAMSRAGNPSVPLSQIGTKAATNHGQAQTTIRSPSYLLYSS